MKRVGVIDNLQDPLGFLAKKYETASASEIMAATGGNTGNVAFVYGTQKIIGNPTIRVGWGWTPEVVRQRVDHLIVCCANQLGAHADLGGWAERIKKFELPVSLIGLGVQSNSISDYPQIPDGTISFLSAVGQCNNSSFSNIAVRGDFTKGFLEALNIESVSVGCPSLHISKDRELGSLILKNQRRSARKKVAVAAGNPWHGGSAFLERILVDIVNNNDGEYILQHPESMLSVALQDTMVDGKTINRFVDVYGFANKEELFEWYRKNAIFFVDAANWMVSLRRFDSVIGPRYHGVALGVQVGIPGCVIAIDSRTDELTTTTGIKKLMLEDITSCDSFDLLKMAEWSEEDALKFNDNRRKKAQMYVEFIENNGLVPSDHLRSLV